MCSSYYEHISNIRASESTYLSLISSEPIWFLEIVWTVRLQFRTKSSSMRLIGQYKDINF